MIHTALILAALIQSLGAALDSIHVPTRCDSVQECAARLCRTDSECEGIDPF